MSLAGVLGGAFFKALFGSILEALGLRRRERQLEESGALKQREADLTASAKRTDEAGAIKSQSNAPDPGDLREDL